ncbi:unnamed protein product [Symbiodinium necroappetens]|uniref:Uncharacterized protein n=1 Tax=Symbiodinium necroappetens TaxID=1628268 RepID=A0A813B3E3_9DINO|nr:unnamed protein product [Symbiodinium necroappetens]
MAEAVVVVVSVGNSVLLGSGLGCLYADKVQKGDWDDYLYIKELLAQPAADMMQRGLLQVLRIHGTCAALITPGFPSEDMPLLEPPDRADSRDVRKTPEILFDYQVHKVEDGDSSDFMIPQCAIPAFLADNGIGIPSSNQLLGGIDQYLRKTMSLIECRVIGEYSLSKRRYGMMLSAVETVGQLQPGDVVIFLKMDLNFADEYLSDPLGFEEHLKHKLVEAMLLQNIPEVPESGAEFMKKLKTALVQHIRIQSVSEGCIEVVFILAGVALVCIALVAAVMLGAPFRVTTKLDEATIADVEIGPQPRIQEARTVSITVEPDGRYQITGTLHTDAPAPQQNPCVIL